MKLRLLAGDVYDPIRPRTLRSSAPAGATPDWFNSIPSGARRAYVKVPLLPFVSWGIGRWGGYIGFKVYGFDAPSISITQESKLRTLHPALWRCVSPCVSLLTGLDKGAIS